MNTNLYIYQNNHIYINYSFYFFNFIWAKRNKFNIVKYTAISQPETI